MTNGNCIEVVGLSRELIGVRDSKDPAGPVLVLTADQWSTLAQSL